MKNSKTILVTLILLSSFVLNFAGQTGKISGKILDSQNQEALIGVNVVIEGLWVGSSTDQDGHYFILNIPPGKYTVKYMMIGYTPLVLSEVRVSMDQTTRLDQELTPEVLGMDEVHVVATRPVVVKDLSASQMYVKEETIKELPIDNISNVIALQAGVQGLSVRGGGSAQTAFIVDGFQLNDGRSNLPSLSLSLSSVKEIQVQSGGFNAEYGNIRSGIINVITREGKSDRYTGSLAYYYTPPAPKNYGISPFDADSYYLKPYLDDAVAWTGTQGESFEDLNSNQEWDMGEPFEDFDGDGEWTGWDSYTKEQYVDFEGWNAISLLSLSDSDPNNDLTPTGAQQEFLWKHRRVGFITDPDYTLDFGLGGPVPLLSSNGNTRFHLSHQNSLNTFVVPLSRDGSTSTTTRLKINSDISDKIKLTLTSQYSVDESVSPYTWTTTPTGYMLGSVYSVASRVKGGNNIVFMPSYYSPSDVYRTNLGLKVNHMLNDRSFYEFVYQYQHNKYWTFQTEDRDTSLYEIAPGVWRDEAPYGYDGGEWMNLGRDSSLIQSHSLKADYTNQLNDKNQMKAGILMVYTNLQVRSFTESDKDTWTRSQIYDRPPYSVAAYIQDKLEYEGFIANIGLRAEYNNPNAPVYLLDSYDPNYSQGLGSDIEETVAQDKVGGFWTVSPRLGVSHPITNRSKLYFNYGHFHSEPASSYRFRLQRESNGKVTSIGNPGLGLEQTIAYELGYSQSIRDLYLINIATYYKDVSNQPGWVSYTNVDGGVDYSTPENINYEDIRGIEFTLEKLEGRWLTGFLNYTYMVRSSGFFGLTHYYQDPLDQKEFEATNPRDSRSVPTPYARGNVVFHTPKKFRDSNLANALFANWNLGFLATFNTGSTWEWQEGARTRTRQWVDTYNVNSRLARTFKTDMGDLEFFMDVSNLIDTKWLSYAGFASARDWAAYRTSLHLPWEDELENGDDRFGVYRAWETEFRPMYAIDSISMVQSTPRSHEIYWERSTDNYHKWDDETNGWVDMNQSEIDELIENKAYIDMPNIRSMSFLNPRQITLGIRIKF